MLIDMPSLRGGLTQGDRGHEERDGKADSRQTADNGDLRHRDRRRQAQPHFLAYITEGKNTDSLTDDQREKNKPSDRAGDRLAAEQHSRVGQPEGQKPDVDDGGDEMFELIHRVIMGVLSGLEESRVTLRVGHKGDRKSVV